MCKRSQWRAVIHLKDHSSHWKHINRTEKRDKRNAFKQAKNKIIENMDENNWKIKVKFDPRMHLIFFSFSSLYSLSCWIFTISCISFCFFLRRRCLFSVKSSVSRKVKKCNWLIKKRRRRSEKKRQKEAICL